MPVRNHPLSALGSAALAGLLIVTLGACGDDEPARDDTTNEITEAGDADVFSIQVGDCLTDESSMTGEVEQVPVVPCSEPHASEVYLSHMIDSDELPDQTAMQDIVTEQCVGGFDSFVGLPYDESVLEVTWLEPTSASWDNGDRELLCIVVDPAGDVTGSLEGAAR